MVPEAFHLTDELDSENSKRILVTVTNLFEWILRALPDPSQLPLITQQECHHVQAPLHGELDVYDVPSLIDQLRGLGEQFPGKTSAKSGKFISIKKTSPDDNLKQNYSNVDKQLFSVKIERNPEAVVSSVLS